jgi:hypothetical protein
LGFLSFIIFVAENFIADKFRRKPTFEQAAIFTHGAGAQFKLQRMQKVAEEFNLST